jgi:uncharacterized membrane protein
MTRSFAIVCTTLGIIGFWISPGCAQTAQQQSLETNTNRVGADYRNFDLPPRGPGDLWGPDVNCQLTCQQDGNCRAWTFVNAGIQGPNGRCWLKNAIPIATSNTCCTSGVVTKPFEPTINRPGSDYKNFSLPTADANQCQAACSADNQCQAWTYVNPGIQGATAHCWLKNPAPAADTDSCCTSGVVNRPPPIQ